MQVRDEIIARRHRRRASNVNRSVGRRSRTGLRQAAIAEANRILASGPSIESAVTGMGELFDQLFGRPANRVGERGRVRLVQRHDQGERVHVRLGRRSRPRQPTGPRGAGRLVDPADRVGLQDGGRRPRRVRPRHGRHQGRRVPPAPRGNRPHRHADRRGHRPARHVRRRLVFGDVRDARLGGRQHQARPVDPAVGDVGRWRPTSPRRSPSTSSPATRRGARRHPTRVGPGAATRRSPSSSEPQNPRSTARARDTAEPVEPASR